MNQSKWTIESVQERLNLAAQVDRALPAVYHKGASGKKWDIVREWYELLWDTDDKDRIVKFRPTNQQVSQWEEVVLRWFKLIESPTDKKIIWLHACGMSMRNMSKKLNIERHKLSNDHKEALNSLTKRLNQI